MPRRLAVPALSLTLPAIGCTTASTSETGGTTLGSTGGSTEAPSSTGRPGTTTAPGTGTDEPPTSSDPGTTDPTTGASASTGDPETTDGTTTGTTWHAWSDRYLEADAAHQINMGLFRCGVPKSGHTAGERWPEVDDRMAQTNCEIMQLIEAKAGL